MSTDNVSAKNGRTESWEDKLRKKLAAGDEMADSSLRMALNWSRPLVRHREIPTFANFFLGQCHLRQAIACGDGPPVCYMDNSEAIYDKWALAYWLCEKGCSARIMTPYRSHDKIPHSWFACDEFYCRNLQQINAYEVILHRKAEEDDIIAQNMLVLAIDWSMSVVEQDEIGEFTDGLISSHEFYQWVVIEGMEADSCPGPFFFDKWELVFWLYECIDKMPESLFGAGRMPIITPMDNLQKYIGQMAAADANFRLSLEHDPRPDDVDPRHGRPSRDVLLDLGWNNMEIRKLFAEAMLDVVSLEENKGELTNAEVDDKTGLILQKLEKMNVLMGRDMLETFKTLKSGGYEIHISLGRWNVAGWFDNMIRTIPKSLSRRR